MKVIFLDIDGVLNDPSSTSVCCGMIGVDDAKVRNLRKIVRRTGAEIVLTSSWKQDWEPENKSAQNEPGSYLDRKFSRRGLRILDKTQDAVLDRGTGIRAWLQDHPEVTAWIVLDDDIFQDYEDCGILEHLILTEYAAGGGLRRKHVRKACALLNQPE